MPRDPRLAEPLLAQRGDPVTFFLGDLVIRHRPFLWDEPRPLTADLRRQLLSDTDKSTTHQLRGVRAARENVSLFPWLDSESRTLDAEFVFWSDQLFPQPEEESACLQTFRAYIDLCERIRALSPGSQCALSASETGDPRDDREKPWTCWW
jgi:hypothetical protein